MKKLAKDPSAVSEVVGALMLVLIVVVAASSFALFISQQQKIQQANQLIQTEKDGESLLISSLRTNLTTNQDYWTSLNITISSLHQGDSEIDRISINDHVLRSFHVARFNTSSSVYEYVQLDYLSKFIINSQQTVNLNITMSDFFDPGSFNINNTNIPIKVDLFTGYSNSFDKVFYTPTPIINIDVESQWNGSTTNGGPNYTAFLILDGSQSDQPGDTTIVKWNWTIEWGLGNHIEESGRKVRFDPPESGKYYTIILLVENANGMVGKTSTTYYH